MVCDTYNKDTEPEKHASNNLILQKIRDNIAFLIKNNINGDASISHYVKSSLETAYIDIVLYLEHTDEEFDNE